MKKLVVLLFLFQVGIFSLAMEKNKGNKGILVNTDQGIVLSWGKEQFSVSCSINNFMLWLALGSDSLIIEKSKILVDRKSCATIIRQSIPQFPQNIYDIRDCTVLEPDFLFQSRLPIVASNKTGSLKTGWPLEGTNNSQIRRGFTIEADGKKYYICESINQEINSKLESALQRQQSFIFSLCSTTNPQATFNLLINDFSRKISQPIVTEQKTVLSLFDFKSIPEVDKDDCFEFDPADDPTKPISIKDNKQSTNISSQSSWKKLLYIGIPIGFIALAFLLWKQNILKFSL